MASIVGKMKKGRLTWFGHVKSRWLAVVGLKRGRVRQKKCWGEVIR